MLPVNSGSHAAYQNFLVENLRKYYPGPDVFSKSTWDIIERFRNLDLTYTDELLRDKYSVFGPRPRAPSYMQRSYLLSIDFKVCSITNCNCDHFFSQPDCDIGWDSSRDCFYHDYGLYMLVSADSESDLPVFLLLNPASKHDSHGFLECFFRFKSLLPDYHVRKWLLDSAHDAMPYYLYCRRNDDGCEPSKARLKFRCPLASRKYGCSCTTPCSDSKYGRTVHLAMKDNPRLINFPPRDSKEWKQEYNARTSAERSNKREKIDFQLESCRHRSTKMWYCRLYHILMLQHLDA